MGKAWSSIDEVPYCFSRSSVKFQGHMGKKIDDFDPNLKFPDCNFSLNWPMTMKWCTKLEECQVSCPIVFQGQRSNFKVTRDKKSLILTLIWRFRTVAPVLIDQCLWMMHKAWNSIEEVAYCFSRSSAKFQGHTGQKITNFDLNWGFPDCDSSLIIYLWLRNNAQSLM